MLIANIDAFKSWVQKKVGPITDADPATLARYVAALVKKDKPEAVLRETCLQDLNIFLLDNTKSFVEALFLALSTLSYLTDQVAPDSTVADIGPLKQPAETLRNVPTSGCMEQKVLEKSSAGIDSRADSGGRRDSGTIERNSGTTERSRSRRSSSREERSRQSVSQRLYSNSRRDRSSPVFSRLGHRQHTPERRHREPLGRRTSREFTNRHLYSSYDRHDIRRDVEGRLRGRSQSHSPRTKPRDRSQSRSRVHSRSPRSKHQGRSTSRSRVRSRSPRSKPHERSTSRSHFRHSRSPHSRPHELSTSRSHVHMYSQSPRSRLREQSTSQTRVRSQSPQVKPREHSTSPTTPKSPPHVISVVSSVLRMDQGGETALDDVEHSPSSDDRDESDYRITVPLDAMNDLARPPLSAEIVGHRPSVWPTSQILVKPRCRDFDEKGFCVRGDLCPFDHGLDPVVVDDVLLTPPPPLPFPVGDHQRPHVAVSTLARPLPPAVPVQVPLDLPVCTAAQLGALTSLPPALPLQQGSLLTTNLPPPPFLPNVVVPSTISTLPGSKPVLSSAYPQRQPYVQHSFIHQAPPRPRHTYHVNQHLMTRSPLSVIQSDGFPVQGGLIAVDARRVIETKQPSVPPTSSSGNNSGASSHSTRKVFDHSRLGSRTSFLEPGSPSDAASTSLILDNIPPALNTICNINEHFSKFGTVVNVQVHYSGSPSSALVTFANSSQAAEAYHCKQPVLNNRFITVNWQTAVASNLLDSRSIDIRSAPSQRVSAKERLGIVHESADGAKTSWPTTPTVVQTSLSVHDRLGALPAAASQLPSSKSPPDSKSLVLSTTGTITKTVFNIRKTPATRKLLTTATNSQEGASTTSESNTKLHKDAEKMKLELLRQKQMLMSKQIEKQKSLLTMLENPALSSADKTAALKMLKTLIASVDKLKSELNSAATSRQPKQQQQQAVPTGAIQQTAATPMSDTTTTEMAPPLPVSLVNQDPHKAKRLVLDAELELIAKQNKGENNVSELDRRVSALKYQASRLGLFGVASMSHHLAKARRTTWSRGRGRGQLGLRSKWYSRPLLTKSHQSTVDHRPKEFVVTGFEEADRAAVIEHFKNFGGIASSLSTDNENSVLGETRVLLSFQTRQQAEHAMSQGACFSGKWLTLTWHQTYAPTSITKQHQLASVEPAANTVEEQVVVHMLGVEGEDDDVESDALVVDQSHSEEHRRSLYAIASEIEFDEEALLGTDEEGVMLD